MSRTLDRLTAEERAALEAAQAEGRQAGVVADATTAAATTATATVSTNATATAASTLAASAPSTAVPILGLCRPRSTRSPRSASRSTCGAPRARLLRLLRAHARGVPFGRCLAPRTARPPSRGSARRRGRALRPGDLIFWYSPVSHVGMASATATSSTPATRASTSSCSRWPATPAPYTEPAASLVRPRLLPLRPRSCWGRRPSLSRVAALLRRALRSGRRRRPSSSPRPCGTPSPRDQAAFTACFTAGAHPRHRLVRHVDAARRGRPPDADRALAVTWRVGAEPESSHAELTLTLAGGLVDAVARRRAPHRSGCGSRLRSPRTGRSASSPPPAGGSVAGRRRHRRTLRGWVMRGRPVGAGRRPGGRGGGGRPRVPAPCRGCRRGSGNRAHHPGPWPVVVVDGTAAQAWTAEDRAGLLTHEGVHAAQDTARPPSALARREGVARWVTRPLWPAGAAADAAALAGLPAEVGLPADAEFTDPAAAAGAYARAELAVAGLVAAYGRDRVCRLASRVGGVGDRRARGDRLASPSGRGAVEAAAAPSASDRRDSVAARGRGTRACRRRSCGRRCPWWPRGSCRAASPRCSRCWTPADGSSPPAEAGTTWSTRER